ncbi:uncharacterized protein LOC131884018 [Tigriopus californicus]|uniref:uncharacterized protein LOC131884018 n=1 Tax=Tigriopus californicus TaxID=6832 RepID=UPI0027DA973A|nr:uncharacterized protein LOC131884018 [Tigriopus californicus]|eukprot:TCALIF_08162-PA protein Name:"Similar to setd7 Histone-lysine N-methyltransferase SETD7 (Xenopus tropicalis)" AED:0.24 eAED:0.29 QI:0/-1/0/1/-1/1/1/0/782
MWSSIGVTILILNLAAGITKAEQACHVEDKQCLEINVRQIQNIQDWWKRQSMMKPVKCHGPPPVDLGEVNPKKSIPILSSKLCDPKQKFRPHAFRGDIDINGHYQGSGKFKLEPTNDDSQINGNVCFSRGSLLGQAPVNITGKFKDGIPYGLLKVETDSNHTVIGQFVDGSPHGYLRRWNQTKQLKLLGHLNDGVFRGRCWFSYHGLLMEENCEHVGTWEKGQDQTLVFLNSTTVIAGRHNSWGNFIDDARFVRIDSTSEQDCQMVVKYSVMKGTPFRFNKFTKEFQFLDGPEYPDCPYSGTWNKKNVTRGLLKEWFNPLSGMDFENIWRQRESSLPVSPQAPKLFQDIQKMDSGLYNCLAMGSQERLQFKVLKGLIDNKGRFQGLFAFKFVNGVGIPEPFFDSGWVEIHGFMKDNVPIRTVIFQYPEGRILSARVKEGVLHGMSSLFGVRAIYPLAKEFGFTILERSNISRGHGVAGLFNFRNGKPHGNAWIRLLSDGFIHGRFNENGSLTGDNLSFIYPDMSIAYVGQFENMVMKAAKVAEVVAERCDEFGIKEVQYSEPSGPDVFYSPPTNISFGEGPRIPDPYEQSNVVLKQSNVPNGGQGLFAKKDILHNQKFCFYSGYIYRNDIEVDIYKQRFELNQSLSMDDRRKGITYSIGTTISAAQINIPPELHGPGHWYPTLGHKVQCDFRERGANAVFTDTEHPRYGNVVGLLALRDIKAGEEIFVDYGYKANLAPYDFPWYHEAKRQMLLEKMANEQAENQNQTDDNQENEEIFGDQTP